MKTILPLLFISIFSCFSSEAQGADDSECARLQYILSKSNPIENYSEALTFFMHAEEACDDMGKDNYDRMLVCIQYLIATFEEGSDEYYQYMDTLMHYWEKTEEIDYYSESDDVIRGYYYTLLKEPNFVKADSYFSRGIKNKGMVLDDEVYILLYYYNIYTLWFMEQDAEKKTALRERYIDEYFSLMALIDSANYSSSTKDNLTQYLMQIEPSCQDLALKTESFVKALEVNTSKTTETLATLSQIFKVVGCEHESINTVLELYSTLSNKNIPFAVLIKIVQEQPLNAEKPYDTDSYSLQLAQKYLGLGYFHDAYNAANQVKGKFTGKALVIQANAVAASATTCGETTFERQCNYLYAIQLLEQAQELGVENLSSSIETYRSASPYGSQDCCFGKLHKIVLNCWGVTIEYYE